MTPAKSKEFVRVCTVGEVAEGCARRVQVHGVPVALVHTEGEFFAVTDICSHEEVSLSEGEIDGETIECWLHGSRFDLVTGEPTGLPATKPIAVYEVKIDGDEVSVSVDADAEEN